MTVPITQNMITPKNNTIKDYLLITVYKIENYTVTVRKKYDK